MATPGYNIVASVSGFIPTEEEKYGKIDQRFWNNMQGGSTNFAYEGGELSVSGLAGQELGLPTMYKAWADYLGMMNTSGVGHLANYQGFRQKYEQVFDQHNQDLKNKILALEEVWNVPKTEIRKLINSNPRLSESMYRLILADPSIGDAFSEYTRPQRGAISELAAEHWGGLASEKGLVPGINVGLRAAAGAGIGAIKGALTPYAGAEGAMGKVGSALKGARRGGLAFAGMKPTTSALGAAGSLTEARLGRQTSGVMKQLTKNLTSKKKNKIIVDSFRREMGDELFDKLGKDVATRKLTKQELLKNIRNMKKGSQIAFQYKVGNKMQKAKASKTAINRAIDHVKNVKNPAKLTGAAKNEYVRSKAIKDAAEKKFGLKKSLTKTLTGKQTKKVAMKAVQQQINSYIRKHGVKKLAKKLGVKTMMRLGLGTGLSASGVGTAVGLGLTAWTLFDIYHILKDVHGESKTLLDEGGVSTYLTGSKRANLIAEAQGLTGSRKIR